MRAISIRAPWWWYILYAGKDIENRDWPTSYRGPVLIHASSWWVHHEARDDNLSARRMAVDAGYGGITPNTAEAREWMQPRGGHIVGVAEIVDCVEASDSPWFVGRYGFKLGTVSAFKHPIPCKGALGLFNVPDDFIGHPERA